MAQKRRNGDVADEMNGREKKKLKLSAARTIAVQSTSLAGPSSTKPSNNAQSDSLTGLPSAIDVEKFVEARAFEIDAMHTAMKTASASSTHRVWQTLPRHLRRRAASHDVRRVPLRLRERASAEMDPARKKPLTRAIPKRGKEKRISRTQALLKRQRDKLWLETHLWHAKRMHMETMWGYRLVRGVPHRKAYRPSHRASVHGSILHDASYYSCVEIKGPEKIVVALLESCCDPQGPGPGSKRCLSGSRTLETHIYKRNAYPYDLIAPLTIIWRPQSHDLHPIDKKGKTRDANDAPVTQSNLSNIRSVWLRFHPSMHQAVFDTLKDAASHALANYKTLNGDSEEVSLEITDLKGHLNQVIKGALSPVSSERRQEFLGVFLVIVSQLQSAGSTPRGMIVGFKVIDPRLKFPPKNAKPAKNGSTASTLNQITFPSAYLAESEIWDDVIRNTLAKPRFKKKDLDERRSKNEIPGTPLNAQRQDDRIPVLLIQRSLENSNSTNSPPLHGWTLIIPAGWAMSFFSSLIFTGTRVGGQTERQTQAFEAGTAYFPRDYPSTQPYDAYALDREAKEKTIWDRKPPAKRVNYDKLATKHPWRADWAGILGIAEEPGGNPAGACDLVTTQREPASTVAVSETTPAIRPWLLRGSEVSKILSSMASVFNHVAALLSEINRLRLKPGYGPLSHSIKPADLLKGALINVKITMCLRGSPHDLAMIYSLSDDICRQWEKLLQHQKSSAIPLDDEALEEAQLATTVPSETAGYITTGHYSLARGQGFAIGTISVAHLLELEMQSTR
ncbi:ribonucleases P/MRP protein subunit POP1-domain-containing protein [Flammula alnicola]|nr:ribonucleases P/MRP protein subunit POP1-domain-containing protein [Flammula alnicola]